MLQKDLKYSVLFEYYGALLHEKQAKMLSEYYDLDLSLSEIAENESMTRQGVRDAVKRAEVCLSEYEQRLGLLAKTERLRSLYASARASGDFGELDSFIEEL